MKLLSSVIIVFLSVNAFGFDEGQIRLGVQGGHVGLLQDVGSTHGNGLGLGALVGYLATDDLAFELSYTISNHDNLVHSDFATGVNYYFNNFESFYLYGSGGVNFVNHKLTLIKKSSGAFGLYGGLGADVEVGTKFLAGLQVLYHSVFDSSVKATPSSPSQAAIQDFLTVYFRLQLGIGGTSW